MTTQMFIAVIFCMFALCVVLVALHRQDMRKLTHRLTVLETDLAATRRARGVEAKVIESMRVRIVDYENQRESAKPAQDPAHDQTLKLAIRMAQRGASVDDLVQVCGVTRPEAEIMARMHRHQGEGNDGVTYARTG